MERNQLADKYFQDMRAVKSTHILYITEIQAIALHNFGQRDWSTLPAAVRDESTSTLHLKHYVSTH